MYYILTCIKPTGDIEINGLPFIKEEIYLETEQDYKEYLEICRQNRWKIIKKLEVKDE